MNIRQIINLNLFVASLGCTGVQMYTRMHTEAYFISQQSLAKLQMVPFQDGGSMKLRQRITRPRNTQRRGVMGGYAVRNHAC